MHREVEDQMAGLAQRQHGVVTRRQLLEVGLAPGAVRRRARAGRLRRLHRGVYLVGPLMPPLAREMAAVLACGAGAVLSHRSAAFLWDLVGPSTGDTPVDVIVQAGGSNGRTGIRARRTRRMDATERTIRHGIPVTSPTRTLLDLARAAAGPELERMVAAAERARLVTRSGLLEVCERLDRRPGLPALRAVLETAGGPAFTRSEAEARFLSLLRTARLPTPEVNASVHGYELDFFWRAAGIAVEVDGYRYHASQTRFEGDRRRATHLAARGIHVIPITWRQITEDAIATAVQLGQAMARAGG